MKKKGNFGFSVIYKYIFSSFLIVLIASIMVGLTLYVISVSELKKKHNDMVMYKLGLAASDIENQFDILEDISYRLSMEVYYKKSYLKKNRYYDLVLFDDFVKYKNNSPIISDYFLFYHDENWVYKTNKAKNTFDIFLTSCLIEDDPKDMYFQLNNIDAETIIPCTTPYGNTYIFAWPVYTAGKGNDAGKAVIGFFISPQVFEKRITDIVGELPGNIYVFYKNILVSQFSQNEDFNTSGGVDNLLMLPYDEVLTANNVQFEHNSHQKKFKIVAVAPKNFYDNLNPLSSINIVYLAVIFLLISIVIIGISYYNYKPIMRLRKKYGGFHVNREYRNELNFIEHVFDGILQDKTKVENNLHEQYCILKKQILQLILDGDQRYANLVLKSFMGIKLPGPLYGIMAIKFDKTNLSNESEEKIAMSIEDISDGELYSYFVSTKYKGVYALIISTRDKELLKDAIENIKTLLGEQENSIYGSVSTCKTIQDFPNAFHLSVSNCNIFDTTKVNNFDYVKVNYDEQIVNSMIKAVRYQDSEEAFLYLKLLSEDIKERAPSFLVERYIFSTVFYRLSSFVSERNITLGLDHINAILSATTTDEIISTFKTIIQAICDLENDKREKLKEVSSVNAHLENILEVIDSSYSNSDMSLDMLSNQLELSGKYISSIIKEGTGKAYKDYLISLRISKAQELLMTGNYTVTEVCEKVGYTHLPLFIKTFKRLTGHTPSRFIGEL
jgi:AraC-like DNA-binding protein